jgi:hypothetical protein
LAINPNAVGSKPGPVVPEWDSKDRLLYAMGVGAGTDQLAFIAENTVSLPHSVWPTFAVTA